MIKLIVIVRGFVVFSGMDLVCIFVFIDIEIEGDKKIVIKFIIEFR